MVGWIALAVMAVTIFGILYAFVKSNTPDHIKDAQQMTEKQCEYLYDFLCDTIHDCDIGVRRGDTDWMVHSINGATITIIKQDYPFMEIAIVSGFFKDIVYIRSDPMERRVYGNKLLVKYSKKIDNLIYEERERRSLKTKEEEQEKLTKKITDLYTRSLE